MEREPKIRGFLTILSMFVSPQVDLVLVAALYAVISQTLQTVLTNRREVRKNQKKMQEIQKKNKELMALGDKANPQDVERIQKEMMDNMQLTMKNMPKLMIANIIVWFPILELARHAYNGITVPLFFPFNLIWATTDWFWYYALCSLIIGLFVNHVMNWYHNKKDNEENHHHTHTEGMKNAQ